MSDLIRSDGQKEGIEEVEGGLEEREEVYKIHQFQHNVNIVGVFTEHARLFMSSVLLCCVLEIYCKFLYTFRKSHPQAAFCLSQGDPLKGLGRTLQETV